MSMRFSILTLGDNYQHMRSHEQFYHEVCATKPAGRPALASRAPLG